MTNASRLAIALLVLSPPAATVAMAATPFIKIISPAKGTVVHPGEEVSIVVDATPGAFMAVTASLMASSFSGPPYKLTVRIPSYWIPRQYEVEVSGVPPGRPLGVPADKPEDIVKDIVELDVELVDQPKSLECKVLRGQGIRDDFHRAGEKREIDVRGVFDDETKVELGWSKRTTYTSSDPSVVTVDNGIVASVRPGRAEITVSYGALSVVIPIVVPDMPADIVLDSPESPPDGEPKSLEWRLVSDRGIQDGFRQVGEKRWLYIMGIFGNERFALPWPKLKDCTSSDPSVVTVDNGVVASVGPGRAEITVKYGEVTLIIPIVVPDKPD